MKYNPKRPLASQNMADKKVKATSAFHLLQVPLLVMPRQSKAEPQLRGPMNCRACQIQFPWKQVKR